MRIYQIPRNDIAACVAYYKEHGVTASDVRTMFLLQDDPAEFNRVAKGWKLTATKAMPFERVDPVRADAEWDESLHPRAEDGKWGSGGTDPGRTPDDKAAAAVRGLLPEHRERLIGAADRVRANYPRDQHATDAVHEEAQKELRAEAGRIVREQAVVGNDPRLRAMVDEIEYRYGTGEKVAREHDALMERVVARGAELAQHDEARAAGVVPGVPDEALKAYRAAEAEHTPALDAAHAEVDAASQKALAALGRYGVHDEDGTIYGDSNHEETAELLASASDRLGGKSATNSEGDFADGEGPPSTADYTRLADSSEHPAPDDGPDIPDHFRDEEGELLEKWKPDADWEPEHEIENSYRLGWDDDHKKILPWDGEAFGESESAGRIDPDSRLGEPDERGHVSTKYDPDEHEGLTREEHTEKAREWNAAADKERAEYDAVAAKWKAAEQAEQEHFERVKAEVAARDKVKQQAAENAQTALEELHAKQTAALAQTKTIEKDLKKPLAEAKAEIGEDEFAPEEHAHDRIVEHPAFAAATPADEGDERMFTGEQHERLYHGAQGAFGEDVESARGARESLGARHDEHTQEALKEAASRTADLVKALAKVTGRASAIARATRKKRATDE